MPTSSTSAREAYRRRKRDIAAAMTGIQVLIDQHGRMAAQEPGNCGLVGELGHVRSRLEEVSRFLDRID
jgi:hypothetical protein